MIVGLGEENFREAAGFGEGIVSSPETEVENTGESLMWC